MTEDVTIGGAGPHATIIDGAWSSNPDRLFQATGTGTDAVMTGLTLRDGDGDLSNGGAATVDADASLKVSNAVVTGNKSEYGGGFENHGKLTLDGVLITGNAGHRCCGGIDNEAEAFLTDVAVVGNQAIVSDSGGMYSSVGTFERVTFSGNSSTNEGGGLFVSSSATLTNVTVSGNSSQSDGGGLFANGDVSVNNGTVSSNSAAGNGGGVSVDGTLIMRNSIVAGNTDTDASAPDCEGEITSSGHNLIGSTTGCTFTPATGDLQNTNPMLGPLADNGGFTQTHALLVGSPAIDHGGSDCAATDQRGVARSAACDIGAYELILCKAVAANRIGTEGDDVLTGTSGGDGFLAFGGNDKVQALGGNDTACLGAGNDRANGGGGRDKLFGEQGNDRLAGAGGKDLLVCGPGKKDVGRGGPGNDKTRKCEKGRA